MARTAVLSHIVTDMIRWPGAADRVTQVGGAGAYAAVGASLVSSAGEACLVSGSGRSDRPLLASWCVERGIDPSGLFEVGEHSPHTLIDYREDGERSEAPEFGLDHFDAHTPYPDDIPDHADDYAGVYLFHADEDAYWDRIVAFRRAFARPILWEISLDACTPEHRERVRRRTAQVDILSLNRAEAVLLLGPASPEELLTQLRQWVPIVLLRLGGDGSLIAAGDEVHRLGVAGTEVVDPTGGGNGFSGAFLAAYARDRDVPASARLAAAAAAAVIEQRGTPRVDDSVRRRVRELAATISVERR